MTRRAALAAQLAQLQAELDALPEDPPPVPERLYCGIADFAALISTSVSTVRRMMADGLPYSRPRPHLTRIHIADARRWIEGRRTGTTVRRSAEIAARRGDLQ